MWEGKIVTFEIDDDLDAVLPSSPAYYAYHPGSLELKMIHKVMSWCDGVTTTTPEMARWCYQNNRNVGIIENYIDFGFRDWNCEVLYDNGFPIIKPQPIEKPKEWENKIVVGWQGGTCTLPDTEILTDQGFKLFTELNGEELVATLNPQTQELEYQKPTEYVNVPYKGKIHLVEKNHVNFGVTPNHWMYIAKKGRMSKKDSLYKTVQSQDLFGKPVYLKKDAVWRGEEKEYFTFGELKIPMDSWLKFFGFWLAEGSVCKYLIHKSEKQTSRVEVCQFKSEKILEELQAILLENKISASISGGRLISYNRDLHTYLLQFGSAETKFIPQELLSLSPRQLRILLDYYLMGDGSSELGKTNAKPRLRAYTVSKKLADSLVELALKIGWSANIHNRGKRNAFSPKLNRTIKANYDQLVVSFLRNDGAFNFLNPLVSSKDWKEIDYEGTVHCVTVPNHLIYVRRKGRCMWIGNTHQEDLKVLGPQIRALLAKYPNVHFAMYASPTQATEFIETYKIPEGRYDLIPARHFLDHPKGLHGIDIGLCPLVCNQFNLAKSFLKNLEYFAAGIVPVTSNVGPYSRFNTRHPGYAVHTGIGKNCIAPDLMGGVEYLIQNPDELRERKIKGRQLIIDKYSLEQNISDWPATWNYIKDQKMKGNLGPPVQKKSKREYVTYGSAGPNDSCPCGSGLKYKACCKNSFG
jgi:hypothetical protein